MRQSPTEKLNAFVEEVIEPRIISNSRICQANDILDWLMQKGWTTSLYYTSYPDEKQHTVAEGLKTVFEIVQEMDESIRIIRLLYNKELYKTYMAMDEMPNAEALEKLQTLEKIKALLFQ